MKIVAVSGSLRKDSYNTGILKYIKERYSDKIDIEILNIMEIPFYSEDIEEHPFESVKELREKIKGADGIIFATPEHNNSVPAALKNFIDWMSRVEPVMIGKPGLIMGASLGRLGTTSAQGHLRDILDSPFVGVRLLPANSVKIGEVYNNVDEDKRLINEGLIEFLDTEVNRYIEWVKDFK